MEAYAAIHELDASLDVETFFNDFINHSQEIYAKKKKELFNIFYDYYM